MQSHKKVILHIAAYYSGSPVYCQLVRGLIASGFMQWVYAPVRSENELGKNLIQHDTVDTKYDLTLNRLDRLLFGKKINKLWRRINTKFVLLNVDLVHAHTLFSDGALALKMYNKLQTPYIVAVRNTDLNLFWKYMPHLRTLGRRVLWHAKQIVFLNESYRDALLSRLPAKEKKQLMNKALILPNGIDQYWHDEVGMPKKIHQTSLSFLYVGDYSVNKNVPLLIDIAKYVANSQKDVLVSLYLVGGGNSRGRANIDMNIASKVNDELPSNLHIVEHGKVSSPEKLKKLYRQADFFIMLSKRETFGLVYAEALSQGTPIIYTYGQGISSYFYNFEVGLAVDIYNESIMQIYNNLIMIIENYAEISENCINRVGEFNWERIADEYCTAYNKVLVK